MKKTNPNKVPRTQADVERSYKDGTVFGVEFCLNLILFVLKDKHNAPIDDIMQLRDEFMYQVDSIAKKYMSYQDVVAVLRDEYNITVNLDV